MGKRKKVKVDNKTYNINSPEYKKLYSEGIMSVDSEGIPNYYSPEEATVTAKRINRGEEAVRKGRGKFGAGVLSALDYAMQFGDTPMALALEALTGRGDINAALPNITRSLKKFKLPVDESLKPYETDKDQLSVSEALGIENPYLATPIDMLSSRGGRRKSGKAVKNPKQFFKQLSTEGLPQQYANSNQAGFLNLNALTDKEKEMYDFFLEEERFNKLPNTTNKNALEVLNNFKTRIQTPEGQQRLKKLGITEEQLLHDLSIIDDSNTYGYYRPSRNKIAINPLDPLVNNTTRHEIEHGVQNAFRNSNPNNKGITDIDNLLSGLQLRKEGTLDKTWGKNQTDKAVDVSQYKSLLGEKQRATDYFLTGSKGAEKSAFLAEVQQYMMDQGVIPKTSYKEVTPEMVQNTFADAMFDEDGGRYLRLFNIMKANDNNYNLVSEGLNKMLGLAPGAIATGAALSQLPQEEKALGGKITNNMKKKKNKNLPIDNGLPKAGFGLEMLIPMLGNIGTGVGAASGATSGLGTATGATAGLQSLGNTGSYPNAFQQVSNQNLQNMNVTGTGSSTAPSQKSNPLNSLGGLTQATMGAVTNMIKAIIEPEENYRTTLKNTGAHYANGGEINIKPSKRGTFTAAAKKRGKGVQEFASQVLANKDNYSPAMVKKANFARNAAKWKKAMGGLVDSSYMDVFDAMGYGGNVFDNPEYSDYMALGGITEGNNPIIPPTAADSLNVYNKSQQLQKYYKDQGYQSQGKTKNPIKESNVFKRELDRLYGQFQNQQSTTYPTASGGSASGKLDPKYYRKPTNPNTPYVIEQRESQFGTLDTRAPFGYYDTRMVPKETVSYKNVNMKDPIRGDEVNIPIYDVSVKPYSMRTPAEQAYVEKMYGKPQTPVSIPTPVAEVKPMTMEQRLETNRPSTVNNVTPVSDLRPSAKKYFENYRKEGDPALADRDEVLYRKILRSGVVTGDEAVNLGVPGVLQRFGSQKAMGGMIDPLMAFGGMIDPSMYMEQMMYGSYAQGGQVPQNIPVEVEGEEMYELPDGQTGEFQGPKHENGGIPIALPEGTKIYSDRLKVDGKTMAQRKEKRDNNIKKLEKLLTKNPSDRFIKEAIKRQQETASLEEQGDMQMQEQANQQQAMQEQAMEQMLMGAAQEDIQQGMMAMGGMIKRADGSYSQRGLWDNIRANRGSGKKPTKEMLSQEKKIRAAEKAMGGLVKYGDGTPPYGVATTNFFNPNQYNAPIVPTMEMNLDNYENALNTMGSIYQDVPFQLRTTDPSPTFIYNNDPLSPITMDQRSYTIPTSNYNPTFESNVPAPAEETSSINLRPINATIGDVEESLPSNYTSEKRDRSGFDLSDIFGIFGGGKKEKTPRTGGTSKSTTGDNVRYTEGDRMGMMGNTIGTFGPAAMTMLNWLGTPKNKNFYNTFGQEALRTQMEAEGIAGMAKDEAYRKNLMRSNALRKQLANSARGVGDMRTGQLTAALAEQEGGRDILGSYLQSMAGLKGQRAQLQQQIDQTRMGGEYQRDLANRQDFDKYMESLATDTTTISEGLQKRGRDMNVALRNKDILSLSKYYSAYGIYADYDDNGNLVLKDDSTGKTMSVEEANKKKKEMDEKAKSTTTTNTTTPETTSFPSLDFYNKFGYINQPIKLKGSTDFPTKRKR